MRSGHAPTRRIITGTSLAGHICIYRHYVAECHSCRSPMLDVVHNPHTILPPFYVGISATPPFFRLSLEQGLFVSRSPNYSALVPTLPKLVKSKCRVVLRSAQHFRLSHPKTFIPVGCFEARIRKCLAVHFSHGHVRTLASLTHNINGRPQIRWP